MAGEARWPGSLPEYVLVDGYGEAPRLPKVSFQSDIGPSIDRRKGTMAMKEINCAMIMDDAQIDTFERFVRVDLGHATGVFYGPHPRTREAVRLKLGGDRPYSIAPHALVWRVSFSLLVIG